MIDNNNHTGVYDKHEDHGFLIVFIFLVGCLVMSLDSYHIVYGIYISQLVRFARCDTSVLDFNLKTFKLLLNYWHRVTDIIGSEKHLESPLDDTLNFCKSSAISIQEYVSKGLSYLAFYGDLVYKLTMVKCARMSSGSQIIVVKRFRHQQYDPVWFRRR